MTSLSRCFVAALSLFSVIQSIALPNPQSPDGSPPQNLIGDLRFKQITPVGISVANIILSTESGESSVIGTRPKGNCKKSTDPCCIWYAISADLTNDFLGRTGLCNNNARAAIRLGFHDAGAWSQPRMYSIELFSSRFHSLAIRGTLAAFRTCVLVWIE
jgi:hypothetical protein